MSTKKENYGTRGLSTPDGRATQDQREPRNTAAWLSSDGPSEDARRPHIDASASASGASFAREFIARRSPRYGTRGGKQLGGKDEFVVNHFLVTRETSGNDVWTRRAPRRLPPLGGRCTLSVSELSSGWSARRVFLQRRLVTTSRFMKWWFRRGGVSSRAPEA